MWLLLRALLALTGMMVRAHSSCVLGDLMTTVIWELRLWLRLWVSLSLVLLAAIWSKIRGCGGGDGGGRVRAGAG